MRPIRALLVAERASHHVMDLPPLDETVQVMACDTPEAAVPLAAEADAICCWGGSPFAAAPVIAAAGQLAFIQSLSVGVESLTALPRVQSGEVLLTNARGCNAPAVAEHALAYIFAFSRGLPQAIRAQAEGRWERSFRRAAEIGGTTLGLLGLGAIAQEIAWRAKGLGMRVIAARRHPHLQALPPGVDAVVDVESVLAGSDFLVVCLPLTDETRGLLDAANLRRMKPGAFLVNISRGAVVDEEALLVALESGHLSGAGLDVFQTEPLPGSSPLWRLPGVIITPHVAAASPRTMERTMALLADNLLRFSRHEPLRNLVDWRLGY